MNNLVLFEEKQVRRVWHEEEWWFVITDVIAVLTDSIDPAGYLRDMRRRDPELGALFKGGGKLPPPLHCPLKQRVESRKSSAEKERTQGFNPNQLQGAAGKFTSVARKDRGGC